MALRNERWLDSLGKGGVPKDGAIATVVFAATGLAVRNSFGEGRCAVGREADRLQGRLHRSDQAVHAIVRLVGNRCP
jgi:hypothetical protein